MNAYVVKTRERREVVVPILDDGTGPTETCWPIAPVVAETAPRARYLFVRAGIDGVETDDYLNLSVRLLARDVELPEGIVVGEHAGLWLRIHEVEDHGGKPCDCPEGEAS